MHSYIVINYILLYVIKKKKNNDDMEIDEEKDKPEERETPEIGSLREALWQQ